jgi:hypothetical protein
MQALNFWKNWSLENRVYSFIAILLCFISVLALWYYNFQGPGNVISWDTIQEQKVIESVGHSFSVGPFTLHVPMESFVNFEYFQGSQLQHNFLASYLFLIIFACAVTILVSIITALERFWFYVGAGFVLLFFVSLRFEVLSLFGFEDKTATIGVLVLYGLPTIYFGIFAKYTSFKIRLITFAFITTFVGFLIAYGATVPYPFLQLTMTAYLPALVLSLVFIIMVSHEFFSTFLYLSNQASSKKLRHFVILSAIWLINLVITALHEMGVVNWDFVYINIYLLLSVSAIIGIWGFRERERLYENVLPFAPLGFLFYLAMAVVCFITTAQLLGNANDAPLRIIRHITIFSQVGFGVIFITYVISNFVLLMGDGTDVSKILYKPNRMPYFTYRLGGLIAMLAFVFVSDWKAYVNNGFAGFYNYAGDLYAQQQHPLYAESFYKQAAAYGFANHRANYALGHLKGERFQFEEAREYYKMANHFNSSDFALANSANTFIWENQVFKAIDSYKQGFERTSSSTIANNIGFAYAKIHNVDSSTHYWDIAKGDRVSKLSAEANFFAFGAVELIPFDADSILKTFSDSHIGTVGNAFALAALHKQPLTVTLDPLASNTLDLFSATLLHNYIIHNVKDLDTTFLQRAEAIIENPNNQEYRLTLLEGLAHGYYFAGKLSKAFELAAQLVYLSDQHKGKFNYVMGLWSLEQGDPWAAVDFFQYARAQSYKDALFYYAIALTESRQIEQALQAWNEVNQSEILAQQQVAQQMMHILTVSYNEVLNSTPRDKYQFSRYRIGVKDSIAFNNLLNSFTHDDYKGQALLDMSKKYYEVGQLVPCIQYFNRIAGLQLTNERLFKDVQHFELRMLAFRKEARLLALQINKGVDFKGYNNEKALYTAVIGESSGDTTLASQQYKALKYNSFYFVEGILAAADYYREKDDSNLEAYTILSEAVQMNRHSYLLWNAYIKEAERVGLSVYAASAEEIKKSILSDRQRSLLR